MIDSEDIEFAVTGLPIIICLIVCIMSYDARVIADVQAVHSVEGTENER